MRMIVTSLGMALALAVAGAAEAADWCIAPDACLPAAQAHVPVAAEAPCPGAPRVACPVNCGRPDCVVVVEMKKVKKHVWVVECEEHCPPLPGSRLLGGCRDGGCGTGGACVRPSALGAPCGTCDPCAAIRAQAQCPPRCGHARCRKVLKRKEIECEVPVYKCVPAAQAGCPAGVGGCHSGPPADGATTMRYERSDVAPLPPVVGTAYLQ